MITPSPAAPLAPEACGPLELLVIQPTPFCNIDCSYCYLPDRDSRKKMSTEVLHAVFARVFESDLVRHPFTVLWHAGEPLVMPPRFYEEAVGIAREHNREEMPVLHAVQTNATLISREWCDLFKAHDFLVGVSVDGPAFLHDRHRKTRRGEGTFTRVREGLRILAEEGVPVQVISVLTAYSLDYPDELFDFYQEVGAREVAFNVEEVEGPHARSTMQRAEIDARYRRFLDRFFTLATRASPPLFVRELDLALRSGGDGERAQEVTPFKIVNVDCEGNFSTFSPELLGIEGGPYGGFGLGNVLTDSLESVRSSPRLLALAADVAEGVERCRQTCPYFRRCGGVAPANKYFENGDLRSTETLFCRLTRKAVLDVTFAGLRRGAWSLPEPEEGPPEEGA
jgi:uncharacterized protein